jgi:hypothetical protein
MVVSAEFLFHDIDGSEFVKCGGYAMCIRSSLRDKRPGPPEGFDFLAVCCSLGVWVETVHGGGDGDATEIKRQLRAEKREEKQCGRRREGKYIDARGGHETKTKSEYETRALRLDISLREYSLGKSRFRHIGREERGIKGKLDKELQRHVHIKNKGASISGTREYSYMEQGTRCEGIKEDQ